MTSAPLPRRGFILSALAMGAGVTVLPGCAAVTAVGAATAPLDTFDLRVEAARAPRAARALARAVIIEQPEVAGALDTDRIMVRPNPLQAEFLPGARWAEAPGPLLQGLIVRNLEDSGGLRFVGRRPVGPGGDFALIGTLTDFQAELGEDDAISVHIRYSARLVRESDAAIIAARVFDTRVPVGSSAALPLVEGFNSAAETVIPEISRWVLTTLGARLTG
ncbi:MAG: ABC-type transport auxiliary lipoprotein family protein [Pararhodobacter sp.]